MNKSEFLKKINGGYERGARAKIAKTLDLNLAGVSRWFQGKEKPSLQNIDKMARIFKIDAEEIKSVFYEQKQDNIDEMSKSIKIMPLTPNNTIQLPILADVPAGLPDYSDRDVEIFKDIPRDMFPGADFIIRCIGDSLSPKFEVGDFCVIRKQIEPMHGKAMLVETENGYCMKVINKTAKGVQLCSINKKYKPFYPKQLRIVGLIIGLWARTDKENLLEIA